jgi:putative flavoprotein involved in K+ transport
VHIQPPDTIGRGGPVGRGDTIDTVVVGAGHAGLAVSRLLTAAGHHHLVLDRGRIAERWRSERWDSLHLLSPAWMTRLPGWYHRGADPEAFLPAGWFVRHLEGYADSFGAPVLARTSVRSVELLSSGDRYRVATDQGDWLARNVVVATGPHGVPRLPAGLLPPAVRPDGGVPGVHVVTSNRYRNPEQLPSGGVLVVGASASGVQIADELAAAGRDVVVAVGRHTRMPRRYRGMDAFWWLEATGRLARTVDDLRDPAAARHEPSLQLVGRPDATGPGDLDLGVLQDRGVRLAGRLREVTGGRARFDTSLPDTVGEADRRMHRFLDVADDHAARNGLSRELLPPRRPRPVDVPGAPETLDLRAEGIGTVVVAAGYRPHHPWLRVPVTGPDGSITQHRGVTPAPGLYVVGQRFQHRRDSGFIDGARHDAHHVVTHLLARAAHPGRPVPRVTTSTAVPGPRDHSGSEEPVL